MTSLSHSELITYWHQLEKAATKGKIELLDAFLEAGCSDATFYRARKFVDTGVGTSMREETAQNVFKAIKALAAKPYERETSST